MQEKSHKVEYSFLLEQGFKKIDSYDNVFFNQHGYNYFIMTYKLKKNLSVEWTPNSMILELCGKNGFIQNITESEFILLKKILSKRKKFVNLLDEAIYRAC